MAESKENKVKKQKSKKVSGSKKTEKVEVKRTETKKSEKPSLKTKSKKPQSKAGQPLVEKAKSQKQDNLFAVIKTGGKQYLVKEGDVLEIEKLEVKEKQDVNFEDVLLVFDEKDIKIGTPKVNGAKVKARVLFQKKGEKLVIFKYKPKKRYRKKSGHRQKLTEVEIKKIEMK